MNNTVTSYKELDHVLLQGVDHQIKHLICLVDPMIRAWQKDVIWLFLDQVAVMIIK